MFKGSGSDAEWEFTRFALDSWPRLRWSAYLLCGDHHTAEDLAQTALARAYSAWGRVRHDDAMAYTRKILVNLNIDRLRRQRGRIVGDEELSYLPAAADTSSDDRDQVVRLLAELSEQERKVVVLRVYYDLSEATVADELKMPKGTVKSTLSRALAKLRDSAHILDFTREMHEHA